MAAGNGLKEAESLAALATEKDVLCVAGLQARSAPSVAYVRDLIEQGYVGEVLSTTLIGSGMGWGPTVEPFNAYLNDKKNGATMLSIALGHAADALCHCLGEPGTIVSTYGVSRVVRSANPEYAVGDLVYSWVRWERFTVVDEPNLQYLQKVKPGVDPAHYLGPFGAPGLTAYAGITRIAKPKSGQTIVVSATTGAVWHGRVAVGKAIGPDRGRHGGLRGEGALPGR
jgi:predicted dehydrogenase